MMRSFVVGVLLFLLVSLLQLSAGYKHHHFLRKTTGVTCQKPIDLVLVLDGSGSINDNGWNSIKSFCLEILNSFNVSAEGTHIGIVQFSSTSETTYEIHLTGDAKAIESAIINMKQQKGWTDIGTGLLLSHKDIMLLGRKNVSHLTILMTDGMSNAGPDPVAIANDAKSNGTEIFAIGVGNDADFATLKKIASSPVEGHLFNVSSFAQLREILQNIVAKSCLHIIEIDPSHADSSGGTAVRIIGEGFQNLPTLCCKFGNTTVPAVFGTPNIIGCIVPPGVPNTTVSVSVSLDCKEFSQELPFYYDPKPAGCPNNCSGNGICLGSKCLCNTPWTGDACNELPCPNNCNGHGTCNNGTCNCEPPYNGNDCSQSNCPKNCSPPNGICVRDHCECYPPWGGPACDEYACPNACSNHGECKNGQCICDEGWEGPDCSKAVIMCCHYCNRNMDHWSWWAECDAAKCKGYPDRVLVKSWVERSANTVDDCILRST